MRILTGYRGIIDSSTLPLLYNTCTVEYCTKHAYNTPKVWPVDGFSEVKFNRAMKLMFSTLYVYSVQNTGAGKGDCFAPFYERCIS